MRKALLKTVRGEKAKDICRPQKMDVMPYMHSVPQHEKGRREIHDRTSFPAPCKVARLCSRIPGELRKKACAKKHSNRYVDCSVAVVYKIPLSCGRFSVAQTGHCVNERAWLHELSIGKDKRAHLPTNCHACGCVQRFNEIKILNKSKDREARQLAEAQYIRKGASDCESDHLIALYSSEMGFL